MMRNFAVESCPPAGGRGELHRRMGCTFFADCASSQSGGLTGLRQTDTGIAERCVCGYLCRAGVPRWKDRSRKRGGDGSFFFWGYSVYLPK